MGSVAYSMRVYQIDGNDTEAIDVKLKSFFQIGLDQKIIAGGKYVGQTNHDGAVWEIITTTRGLYRLAIRDVPPSPSNSLHPHDQSQSHTYVRSNPARIA
jgi:hypothetical protein